MMVNCRPWYIDFGILLREFRGLMKLAHRTAYIKAILGKPFTGTTGTLKLRGSSTCEYFRNQHHDLP